MTEPEYSTACQDWQERLRAGKPIIPPPIYPDAAEHALRVFKSLRIGDLPGKPTFGEVSYPWVFDFVAAVFGGYNKETGEQLINEYALLISKKNTKSTIAAGIMLTALLTSWRENEEHMIIAPTREVADNSFLAASAMVRADESLSALINISEHRRIMTHHLTNNTLKVVAASVNSLSGKKAGRVLVDELWVFGKHEWAEAMLMEATGGQISRPEGWTIYLTTQSETTPSGVFKNKLEHWRGVRDGTIIDKRVLPIIYEYPQEMIDDGSFCKPENFAISNPNIGASVSGEWLENQLAKVQGRRDGSYQKFIAKHFNVEIRSNLVNNKWAAAEFWNAAAEKMTLGDLMERSEVCVAGIDGGGLDDLLGFAVIVREKGTGRWLSWAHAWAHRIVLDRNPSLRTKLLDFVGDGDLSLVDKPGEDVAELVEYIHKLSHLLPRKSAIGVDAAGITAIVDALTEGGVDIEQIRTVAQGWKLNGAIKTTERMVAGGELVHCGAPIMAWCVQNARVNTNGNAISISKQISTGKIDPLMALFDAIVMMGLNPARAGGQKRKLVLGVLG